MRVLIYSFVLMALTAWTSGTADPIPAPDANPAAAPAADPGLHRGPGKHEEEHDDEEEYANHGENYKNYKYTPMEVKCSAETMCFWVNPITGGGGAYPCCQGCERYCDDGKFTYFVGGSFGYFDCTCCAKESEWCQPKQSSYGSHPKFLGMRKE